MESHTDIHLAAARIVLDKYLRERHLRRTPERYAILAEALAFSGHFYVETLFEKMEQQQFHVSRTTVYATVQLLVDAGILRRHQFDGRQSQYESVADNMDQSHVHLICINCGKVKEMKVSPETQIIAEGKKYRGFLPKYHTTYVYGTCSACRKKLRQAAKAASSTPSKKRILHKPSK